MVLDDIEKAKEKIIGLNKDKRKYLDDYFLKLYLMSTENLAGYLKNYNFKNKSILTTGSSADQIFNLISYGSLDIDHFDINPFVKYYYELKKSAILELNQKNYLKFFNTNNSLNKRILNDKVYYKLSKNLSSDAKLFWDSLYNLFEPLEIREKLFFQETISNNASLLNNDYLSNEKYRSIRKNIEKINVNFINENVTKLDINKKQYDYVLLSNIMDYLFKLNVLIDEEELIASLYASRNFINNFSKILKDDGIMFFNYFWEKEHNYLLYRFDNFFKNNPNISKIDFPNYKRDNEYNDTVMIYKKTK